MRCLVDGVNGVWIEMTSELTSSSSSDISTKSGADRDSLAAKTAFMPKAGARAATARPIRPRPMMPELLAPELHPEHEVERPPLPPAAADQSLAFTQASRHREDQRPRQLSRRLREDVRACS